MQTFTGKTADFTDFSWSSWCSGYTFIKKSKAMNTTFKDRRVLLGVFFVLTGAYLLLRNLDWLPYFFPDYIFSWGTFLILAGLFALGNRQNKTPGIILISLGAYILLPRIFDVSYGELWTFWFWPLILILIGLGFILRRKGGPYSEQPAADAGTISMDFIDEVAVFGGGQRTVFSNHFQGGRITSVFGGLEIDFMNASLAEGQNVIDIFTVFGGSTLIVPADWQVKVEVFALFGGFNDKRSYMPDPLLYNRKELYIRGFVMFGGGEIKSFRVKSS
jgi:predicted membrane protein